MHAGLPQECRPGRRHPALQAEVGAVAVVAQGFLPAAGGAMRETDKPIYTEFHPRWYRPRMSTYWWLKRPSYLAFIAREVSSLFIAWFVIYLLLLIEAVDHGKDAYDEFLAWSGHTLVVLLNVVSLFFILIHAATWFNLAPQAMVLRYKG